MTREGLRARLEAATPGPWTTKYESSRLGLIAELGNDVVWPVGDTMPLGSKDDAALIAAARQDLPALLAVADAAKALLRGDDVLAVAEGRLRAALAAVEALP